MTEDYFGPLNTVLDELVARLNQPTTDVGWTTFDTKEQVIQKIESLRSRVNRGDSFALSHLSLLFMATSDLQDISISSGWGTEFVTLAARYDQAAEIAVKGCGFKLKHYFILAAAAILAFVGLSIAKQFP